MSDKKVEEESEKRFSENFELQGLNIGAVARNAFTEGASWQAEQSKNEAISFAEFIFKNNYQSGYGENEDMWCNIQADSNMKNEIQIILTTTQLFQLWKAQQEK